MTHPKFERKFNNFRNWLTGLKIPGKLIFIIMGILATAWFLVRVIPKPSRAAYPCMKAAFPVMATFILWLTSFTGAFVAFKSLGRLFKKSRYLPALAVFVGGLAFSAVLVNTGSLKIKGNTKSVTESVYHPSNEPFGEPQGIVPGRVVWNWDPNATDENCPNTGTDPYVSDDNTDQAIVDAMLTESITALSNSPDAATSWDAIFKIFNSKKGKGEVGYADGETIFIKINEGTSSWYGENWSDPVRVTTKPPIAETSPQVTLGILKQLIEYAGVPQENIWVADPKSHIWQDSYEKFAAVYPNVNYGDRDSDYEGTRTMLTEAIEPSVFFSDKGADMPDAINDTYYAEMVNADYLINLAALKAHARAGITLTAKNHFGSHNRGSAAHMHPGLVAPENDIVERPDYGMYRVLVDIMGSSVLGGNTLLFLVDGLWGGTEATKFPVKWQMQPFNNNWPNSIFMSLDQVALESVCFDFLRHEAEIGADEWMDRPNFAQGVDDYLHQAADSEYWPDGISYDPDNSGTPIGSLGVHEHWNNPTLKQYSQNLGEDQGIELYAIPSDLVADAGTFEAREASTLPSVDGIGDDDCWKTANWNHIDQLWIPWGENNIPMEDFNGRFKVMWSSETNLMYFLVKTTDDVFVDNYEYPDGGYPDYDIVEVFIDEDHSGGGHVFDTDTEDAENAFSYHIAIDQPVDGGSVSIAHVLDIAGTSWGDRTTPDYFDHFPDFTVTRDGNTLTWEFSLEVHSDAYDPADKDASLVALSEGKVMGVSLAYCDNDTPGTARDNFFGSVEVTQEAYNDHWKLADDYGVLTLTAAGQPINHYPQAMTPLPDYEFGERNVEQTILTDLTIFFSDEDGDVLTFNAASSESLLTVEADGKILKGTALSGFRGPAIVTVTASDAMYYNTSLSFQVTAVNHSPEVEAYINDYRVNEIGSTETIVSNLHNVFADPDGDELIFSVSTDDPELSAIVDGNMLKIESSLDYTGPSVVIVTASDGLLETDVTFTVTSDVGISLNEIENSIKLYPNPVNDALNVKFNSSFNGDVFIRILGINGQLHETYYFPKVQHTFQKVIHLESLDRGMYFLEIHSKGAVATRKFVK
ncbi:MAG: DUF362 domain-containing protein [Bacteroidales bacterium]|nr:DUF362 domain-containing protein [Bacteroidales bacterium]